jgi:heavy metal efflux system protein
MIEKIIAYSIKNKFIIALGLFGMIGWGIYSIANLPIDAVPDITNNQVQIITISPTLAAQEVEQFVSYPVELAMQNLPGVDEIRSISRFGLSVVTVVFEDKMGTYLPRQLVSEKLVTVKGEIPEGFGDPEMSPITTGLGEIYQYVLHASEGYEDKYSPMQLRTIQDWLVKRQLAGIAGLVEVNSFGGHLKQYEVGINPEKLRSINVTIAEVFTALERNNENTGGSYIEKGRNAYFIRGEGMVKNLEDIGNIVIRNVEGVPVYIRDIATVHLGMPPRFGAMTRNGEGEVTGGMVLMLKGANTEDVIGRVKERVKQIQKTLPEGVVIEPFIDRSKFIDKTIGTVTKNLLEGGFIVIFILVLLLGNLRAGLIVASVIPLAMLFAISMMRIFGVSANLMSMGAIDFGLVVDGAVIIVESVIFTITYKYGHLKRDLNTEERDAVTNNSAGKMMRSALFGQIIILIVYIPILSLSGIEGKMFNPMAMTVGFAIVGAIILCLTYVPMISALLLKKGDSEKKNISSYIMGAIQWAYTPIIKGALRFRAITLILVLSLFGVSLGVFSKMGGEFIPKLEEGDLAVNFIVKSGSSLTQTIETSTKLEKILLDNFPEVNEVLTRIGAAEIPTDPMPIESGDLFVLLKEKDEWVSADNMSDLVDMMKDKMSIIPGVNFEFSQPIELRFNELMTGVRSDIAIKIYGEDLTVLFENANKLNAMIQGIPGVGDTKVEQIVGLPQMLVTYRRNKLGQYGLNVEELNRLVKTAFAGEAAGVVFEGEKRFDLVVRLEEAYRQNIDNIKNLYITLPSGAQVPLNEVASVELKEGPMQISRDNAKRRIVVGVNVRNRDVETLVEEIQDRLESDLDLPAGYYITYGGQFENLKAAKSRLAFAVPLALVLIFVLLFITFNSVVQGLLIYTAIPLSAIGGIFALYFRDMPFSISAGIGFIALFGVAVLNGIVLIAYFNELESEGIKDIRERILRGTRVRLRPVIMTASVASLGFLPMALSASAGAEVQRPLATVVIGGLISATILTLVVLPVLYSIVAGWKARRMARKSIAAGIIAVLVSLGGNDVIAQTQPISIDSALQNAMRNHPVIKAADYQLQSQTALRKSAFVLPNTNIYYEGTALGKENSNLQHDFGINQSISLPKVYKSRNELQEQIIGLSGTNREITTKFLTREVKLAYYNLLALQQKEKVYDFLEGMYQEFNELADFRYQTGETNLLEKVSIENTYQELSVIRNQATLLTEQASNNLQLLLKLDYAPSAEEDTLRRLTIDTIGRRLTDHPVARYYQKLQSVVQAQQEVERSNLLPDFNAGYAYQTFDRVGGFSGVTVGVGIPLSQKSLRKRIDAAEIREMAVQSQYDGQLLMLEQELNLYLQRMQQLDAALLFYEQQGQQLASEILRSAQLNYGAGEVGYIEYLQGLQQVLNLRIGYFENLQNYNMAVIQVNYLLEEN